MATSSNFCTYRLSCQERVSTLTFANMENSHVYMLKYYFVTM